MNAGIIDLNAFCSELCDYLESLQFDLTTPKSAGPEPELRLDEKSREELMEQCKLLVERHTIGSNSLRSRGTSFVIGDDTSSTTSAAPSLSSGVHSAFSDAEVQVDLQQQQQRPSAVAQTVAPSDSGSLATLAYATAKPATTTTTAASSREDELLLGELRQGRLKHRMLEQRCSASKAVELRRLYLEECHQQQSLHRLPYQNYDYTEVKDACCENVVGFVPLPTGIAGPLRFEADELVQIPLSTTEGALVASVSRGCLSINESISVLGQQAFCVELIRDGMSRAPVLEFPRIKEATECLRWLNRADTFALIKRNFEQTSNYACLQRLDTHLEGTYLYLRFVASTGDAMGMNMVTKGTSKALAVVKREFPQGKLISISGNMCVDKKPSALNWLEGRGKSVVAEAFIPAPIVERVLRTSVDKMVKLGHAKLLVGSSAAITIGGWNAHAANVVAAMFLATGQDAAQVVSSSMCLTQLARRSEDGALHITCTMNCLEVGTIGGGTVLSPQGACLEMLGCRRSGLAPGKNAERFARLVCATVLAGELSLLASQCTEGDLEKSHLRLNRSSRNLMMTSGGSMQNMAQQHQSPSLLSVPSSSSSSPYRKSSSSATIMRNIPEHQAFPEPTEDLLFPDPQKPTTKPRSNSLSQKLRGNKSGILPCGPL